MDSLEDHKGFGTLHPSFGGLEPPLAIIRDNMPLLTKLLLLLLLLTSGKSRRHEAD